MWDLQRPVSRDALMSHLGRNVSGTCMKSLEAHQLVVRHESKPVLWSLTPAGEQLAQAQPQ